MSCGPAQLEPLKPEEVPAMEFVHVDETSVSELVRMSLPDNESSQSSSYEDTEDEDDEERGGNTYNESNDLDGSSQDLPSSSSSMVSPLPELPLAQSSSFSPSPIPQGLTPRTDTENEPTSTRQVETKFKNFFEELPKRFLRGRGDHFEKVRRLFLAFMVKAQTSSEYGSPTIASIQSLLFWGMFSTYNGMVDDITMDNVNILESTYDAMCSSCSVLMKKQLYEEFPSSPIDLGVVCSNLDTEVGMKKFSEEVPPTMQIPGEQYVTGPGPLANGKLRTLFEEFVFHMSSPRNLYSTYANAMLSYISCALSSGRVYIAGLLMRYTVFSINITTRLLEKGHHKDRAPVDLYNWINGMLLNYACQIAKVLFYSKGEYERRIVNERLHLLIRQDPYIVDGSGFEATKRGDVVAVVMSKQGPSAVEATSVKSSWCSLS